MWLEFGRVLFRSDVLEVDPRRDSPEQSREPGGGELSVKTVRVLVYNIRGSQALYPLPGRMYWRWTRAVTVPISHVSREVVSYRTRL